MMKAENFPKLNIIIIPAIALWLMSIAAWNVLL